MIVAVALNPALDLTYEVDALVPGATNRVGRVHRRAAGGKAVNVCRVLAGLGHEVKVVGFAGGANGAELADELAAEGLAQQWVPVAGETRRTVAVWARETDEVTSLNEPGPSVSAADWGALVDAVRATKPEALVLSGSLPPGLAPDAYAELVGVGRSLGAIVTLDTDGPGFLPGVAAGPDVVKPNRDELAAATGCGSVREAAESLRAQGAGAVVASSGRDGLIGVTAEGAWIARPRPVPGNATGAGDACVAGLVVGAVEGMPWPDRLRLAAAMGAAAAGAPVAGLVTDECVAAHIVATTVEEI